MPSGMIVVGLLVAYDGPLPLTKDYSVAQGPLPTLEMPWRFQSFELRWGSRAEQVRRWLAGQTGPSLCRVQHQDGTRNAAP